MDELDLIIIKFLNKKGVIARNNIALTMHMDRKDKIKILKYLIKLYSVNILPSDKRVRSKIKKILGGDI